MRGLGFCCTVLLISSLAITSVAAWHVASRFKPGIDLPASASGQTAPGIGSMEGGVNFLLVGNDSGGGNPKYGDRGGAILNDVTVLVHLSSDHSHATIVSFPRDMFVSIPACPDGTGGTHSAMSSQKINTAYSYGGVACVAATVTDLTGLPIAYAADVDFDGAVAVADAIGGVEVCLASPIRDAHTNPPLDLPAGDVTLEGQEAVSFLRTRYGVGDGSDLGRVSNQQLFFAALVRQTRQRLSDLPTLYRIATSAAEHMSMSTSLQNVTTLVSIALAFAEVPVANIVFVTYPNHYPGLGEPDVNGVLPSVEQAERLTGALLADRRVTVTAGTTNTGATVSVPGSEAPGVGSGATAAPSTDDTPVELGAGAFGQSAADITCAAKP